MSGYCHLSLDERFAIARLHEIGISRRSIARELGRSPSTIKRELMRNSNADGRYRPETVEARYLARRTKGLLLDRLDGLASFVVERLHENWTPEQIAGWLKSEAERLRAISHETIYAWIYGRSQRQANLWRLLSRKKGKRGFRPARTPRVTIKDRRSIHNRPKAVDDRAEGGHWEGDLLMRKVPRSVHEAARDVVRRLKDTPAYQRSRDERKKVEMLFAHLKRIMKLDRLRLRGPTGARDEFLLAATAQNLRKLAKLVPEPGPPGVSCV